MAKTTITIKYLVYQQLDCTGCQTQQNFHYQQLIGNERIAEEANVIEMSSGSKAIAPEQCCALVQRNPSAAWCLQVAPITVVHHAPTLCVVMAVHCCATHCVHCRYGSPQYLSKNGTAPAKCKKHDTKWSKDAIQHMLHL